MRVIAGEHRGRRLVAPEGWTTRPTSDRARETVFNMLNSRLDGGFAGLMVADLFAGTGALGVEAISRGAAHATLIDNAPSAIRAIRENTETLGITDKVTLTRGDATTTAGPIGGPFDVIFLDPPYNTPLAEAAVQNLASGNWTKPGTWVCVETARSDAPEAPDGWVIEKSKTVGKGELTLYRVA